MSTTITIEPVTRIEGHAKVTVHLDEVGQVERARFHVNEFRGFEKFCEGRPFYEMPQITQRICGICPVSHHLASIKACDQIVGVDPPRPAKLLRELMHMGQVIQSHAMHFFELAGPDLLLGFDAEPARRNVAGLAEANPELTLQAIRLRKFGQETIARVGDRRIHPTFAVPGGVNKALSQTDGQAILADLPEMIAIARRGLEIMRGWMEEHAAEMESFAAFSTPWLGMVSGERNTLNLYDGQLRLVDASGRRELARFEGRDYLEKIAEHVEGWSYLKFPYWREAGWPAGAYRVGPLARIQAAERLGAPQAQEELDGFRARMGDRRLDGTLYYHYARLVELLYALERAEALLRDADTYSKDIRGYGEVACGQGVGVIEAPRGTLIHHYWVDEQGRIEKANLIVATGHNNYAMSRAVEEVARSYVKGPEVAEGALNRIEAAIRAYDPCLSCSTHAIGRMPMELVIIEADGKRRQVVRG